MIVQIKEIMDELDWLCGFSDFNFYDRILVKMFENGFMKSLVQTRLNRILDHTMDS